MEEKTQTERITHLSGTPWKMGYAMGRKLGSRLEANIQRYLELRPQPAEALDYERLRLGALDYLHRLPERFQQELEGMAQGAGLPTQRLAEWQYIDPLLYPGCSGFVVEIEGAAWVGRNNDMFAPEMWGYLTVREPTGRIPAMTFGMEGDVFAPTGMNRAQLWLHCHALDALDAPGQGRPHLPSYVILSEALETCASLGEVEARLDQIDRDDGMLLLAVDGKSGEFAVYECGCSAHIRHEPVEGVIIATNHPLSEQESEQDNSHSRYCRIEEMLGELRQRTNSLRLPDDLITILGDEGVERRQPDFATVYSNVACPASGDAWYTFGGYPAASRGNWGKVHIPWGGEETSIAYGE
jgi:hypothetical protein